ncbi:MAG TPA: hypothetical protein V6C69_16610 [Trichormus sp.]|jgi:hypothetical protein
MKEIEHGNCYNFDLPDDCLNEEETRDVINALMFDLRRTPVGTVFVLDISIGEPRKSNMSWKDFLASRTKFKRAEFKKENAKVPENEAIDFLREHFDDILTLPKPPKPGLRRIK